MLRLELELAQRRFRVCNLDDQPDEWRVVELEGKGAIDVADIPERCTATSAICPCSNDAWDVGARAAHALRTDYSGSVRPMDQANTTPLNGHCPTACPQDMPAKHPYHHTITCDFDANHYHSLVVCAA